MKRHISFPDIEQLRHVVKNVKHRATYVKSDDNGNPIYDESLKCPVLTFEGTTKLHGSNCSVAYDGNEIWQQSKESLIDIKNDNAGFSLFVNNNIESFKKIFENIKVENGNIVVIYGEWCGGNIQKGMAINKIPKMFVIFSISIISDLNRIWLNKNQINDILSKNTFSQIKCIYDFEHWYIDIDFNDLSQYLDKLSEMTIKVENECPVGKQLGSIGLGEGIVWKCVSDGYNSSKYWFKVKGEKHKNKPKEKIPIDVERVNSINELVEKILPEWRLDQMMTKTFDLLNGGELDNKKIGILIKNTMLDILKEENDTLEKSGFTSKDITGYVSKKCSSYFFKKFDEQVFNFNRK